MSEISPTKKKKLSSPSSSSSVCVSTSSSNGNRNLDDLDELVYCHLFKYLDLDEVLDLRLLSKRFYSIIHVYHKSIIQLSFFDDHYVYSFRKGNWFSTTKSIRLRNHLYKSKLGLLMNPSNNLINLKYLKIFQDPHEKPFKIEVLNKFTKLQILVIENVMLISDERIQLPDLKALSITLRFYRDSYSLMVDCPNLHSLHLYDDYDEYHESMIIDEPITIENPLTIKYLEVGGFDKSILIFKNLECLQLNYGDKVDDLLMLKNLKNFKKLRNSESIFFSKKFEDELVKLLKLTNKDFEIVLNGVKINEVNKIDEYNQKKSVLEFQLSNYSELEDDLNATQAIDYDNLVSRLPNQPADLFKKYNNIQGIRNDGRIEDENRFINFISECPDLDLLCIRKGSLSQQFYDRLPEICQVTRLLIEENGIELNLEFLMKMIYLRSFETDQEDVINNKLNLNNLKYLKEIAFSIRGYRIFIRKDDKDRYLVRKFSEDILNISFDKLVKYIDSERDKRKSI